MRRDLNI